MVFSFTGKCRCLIFIVDFYCHELQIAIENDGESHNNKVDYDANRQLQLEEYGVKFLRFDDLEVKRNIRWVLDEIWEQIHDLKERSALNENTPLTPLKGRIFANIKFKNPE